MSIGAEVSSERAVQSVGERPVYYARYFGDPVSRLFWHDGGLHFGILPRHASFFRGLIENETHGVLVGEGLMADFDPVGSVHPLFEDCYRLLKTPRIVYWYEWSSEMLREAALQILRLLRVLLDRDLVLRNPHPWNLLYFGKEFLYVNPGSVVPFDVEQFSRAWDKVLRFLIRPVLLINHPGWKGYRAMLRDIHYGIPNGIASDERWMPASFEIGNLRTWLLERADELHDIAVEAADTNWSGYHTHQRFEPGTSWSHKKEILERFLREESPGSLLDLAGNSGYYARVAAAQGVETIATDVEDGLVDEIFHESRRADCQLYPAVIDFTNPTPSFGIDYRWFPAATDRMRSDLVLCYAVEHHLVKGKYRLDADELALGIASFSSKAALVEYVPLPFVPWHTAERLAEAFRPFFARVELLPGSVEDRQLILCNHKLSK